MLPINPFARAKAKAGFTSNLAEGLIPPLREEQEDCEIWWKGEGGSLFIKTWTGRIRGLEQHRSVRFCGDLILKNLAIGIHMVTKKPLERGA